MANLGDIASEPSQLDSLRSEFDEALELMRQGLQPAPAQSPPSPPRGAGPHSAPTTRHITDELLEDVSAQEQASRRRTLAAEGFLSQLRTQYQRGKIGGQIRSAIADSLRDGNKAETEELIAFNNRFSSLQNKDPTEASFFLADWTLQAAQSVPATMKALATQMLVQAGITAAGTLAVSTTVIGGLDLTDAPIGAVAAFVGALRGAAAVRRAGTVLTAGGRASRAATSAKFASAAGISAGAIRGASVSSSIGRAVGSLAVAQQFSKEGTGEFVADFASRGHDIDLIRDIAPTVGWIYGLVESFETFNPLRGIGPFAGSLDDKAGKWVGDFVRERVRAGVIDTVAAFAARHGISTLKEAAEEGAQHFAIWAGGRIGEERGIAVQQGEKARLFMEFDKALSQAVIDNIRNEPEIMATPVGQAIMESIDAAKHALGPSAILGIIGAPGNIMTSASESKQAANEKRLLQQAEDQDIRNERIASGLGIAKEEAAERVERGIPLTKREKLKAQEDSSTEPISKVGMVIESYFGNDGIEGLGQDALNETAKTINALIREDKDLLDELTDLGALDDNNDFFSSGSDLKKHLEVDEVEEVLSQTTGETTETGTEALEEFFKENDKKDIATQRVAVDNLIKTLSTSELERFTVKVGAGETTEGMLADIQKEVLDKFPLPKKKDALKEVTKESDKQAKAAYDRLVRESATKQQRIQSLAGDLIANYVEEGVVDRATGEEVSAKSKKDVLEEREQIERELLNELGGDEDVLNESLNKIQEPGGVIDQKYHEALIASLSGEEEASGGSDNALINEGMARRKKRAYQAKAEANRAPRIEQRIKKLKRDITKLQSTASLPELVDTDANKAASEAAEEKLSSLNSELMDIRVRQPQLMTPTERQTRLQELKNQQDTIVKTVGERFALVAAGLNTLLALPGPRPVSYYWPRIRETLQRFISSRESIFAFIGKSSPADIKSFRIAAEKLDTPGEANNLTIRDLKALNLITNDEAKNMNLGPGHRRAMAISEALGLALSKDPVSMEGAIAIVRVLRMSAKRGLSKGSDSETESNIFAAKLISILDAAGWKVKGTERGLLKNFLHLDPKGGGAEILSASREYNEELTRLRAAVDFSAQPFVPFSLRRDSGSSIIGEEGTTFLDLVDAINPSEAMYKQYIEAVFTRAETLGDTISQDDVAFEAARERALKSLEGVIFGQEDVVETSEKSRAKTELEALQGQVEPSFGIVAIAKTLKTNAGLKERCIAISEGIENAVLTNIATAVGRVREMTAEPEKAASNRAASIKQKIKKLQKGLDRADAFKAETIKQNISSLNSELKVLERGGKAQKARMKKLMDGLKSIPTDSARNAAKHIRDVLKSVSLERADEAQFVSVFAGTTKRGKKKEGRTDVDLLAEEEGFSSAALFGNVHAILSMADFTHKKLNPLLGKIKNAKLGRSKPQKGQRRRILLKHTQELMEAHKIAAILPTLYNPQYLVDLGGQKTTVMELVKSRLPNGVNVVGSGPRPRGTKIAITQENLTDAVLESIDHSINAVLSAGVKSKDLLEKFRNKKLSKQEAGRLVGDMWKANDQNPPKELSEKLAYLEEMASIGFVRVPEKFQHFANSLSGRVNRIIENEIENHSQGRFDIGEKLRRIDSGLSSEEAGAPTGLNWIIENLDEGHQFYDSALGSKKKSPIQKSRLEAQYGGRSGVIQKLGSIFQKYIEKRNLPAPSFVLDLTKVLGLRTSFPSTPEKALKARDTNPWVTAAEEKAAGQGIRSVGREKVSKALIKSKMSDWLTKYKKDIGTSKNVMEKTIELKEALPKTDRLGHVFFELRIQQLHDSRIEKSMNDLIRSVIVQATNDVATDPNVPSMVKKTFSIAGLKGSESRGRIFSLSDEEEMKGSVAEKSAGVAEAESEKPGVRVFRQDQAEKGKVSEEAEGGLDQFTRERDPGTVEIEGDERKAAIQEVSGALEGKQHPVVIDFGIDPDIDPHSVALSGLRGDERILVIAYQLDEENAVRKYGLSHKSQQVLSIIYSDVVLSGGDGTRYDPAFMDLTVRNRSGLKALNQAYKQFYRLSEPHMHPRAFINAKAKKLGQDIYTEADVTAAIRVWNGLVGAEFEETSRGESPYKTVRALKSYEKSLRQADIDIQNFQEEIQAPLPTMPKGTGEIGEQGKKIIELKNQLDIAENALAYLEEDGVSKEVSKKALEKIADILEDILLTSDLLGFRTTRLERTAEVGSGLEGTLYPRPGTIEIPGRENVIAAARLSGLFTLLAKVSAEANMEARLKRGGPQGAKVAELRAKLDRMAAGSYFDQGGEAQIVEEDQLESTPDAQPTLADTLPPETPTIVANAISEQEAISENPINELRSRLMQEDVIPQRLTDAILEADDNSLSLRPGEELKKILDPVTHEAIGVTIHNIQETESPSTVDKLLKTNAKIKGHQLRETLPDAPLTDLGTIRSAIQAVFPQLDIGSYENGGMKLRVLDKDGEVAREVEIRFNPSQSLGFKEQKIIGGMFWLAGQEIQENGKTVVSDTDVIALSGVSSDISTVRHEVMEWIANTVLDKAQRKALLDAFPAQEGEAQFEQVAKAMEKIEAPNPITAWGRAFASIRNFFQLLGILPVTGQEVLESIRKGSLVVKPNPDSDQGAKAVTLPSRAASSKMPLYKLRMLARSVNPNYNPGGKGRSQLVRDMYGSGTKAADLSSEVINDVTRVANKKRGKIKLLSRINHEGFILGRAASLTKDLIGKVAITWPSNFLTQIQFITSNDENSKLQQLTNDLDINGEKQKLHVNRILHETMTKGMGSHLTKFGERLWRGMKKPEVRMVSFPTGEHGKRKDVPLRLGVVLKLYAMTKDSGAQETLMTAESLNMYKGSALGSKDHDRVDGTIDEASLASIVKDVESDPTLMAYMNAHNQTQEIMGDLQEKASEELIDYLAELGFKVTGIDKEGNKVDLSGAYARQVDLNAVVEEGVERKLSSDERNEVARSFGIESQESGLISSFRKADKKDKYTAINVMLPGGPPVLEDMVQYLFKTGSLISRTGSKYKNLWIPDLIEENLSQIDSVSRISGMMVPMFKLRRHLNASTLRTAITNQFSEDFYNSVITGLDTMEGRNSRPDEVDRAANFFVSRLTIFGLVAPATMTKMAMSFPMALSAMKNPSAAIKGAFSKQSKESKDQMRGSDLWNYRYINNRRGDPTYTESAKSGAAAQKFGGSQSIGTRALSIIPWADKGALRKIFQMSEADIRFSHPGLKGQAFWDVVIPHWVNAVRNTQPMSDKQIVASVLADRRGFKKAMMFYGQRTQIINMLLRRLDELRSAVTPEEKKLAARRLALDSVNGLVVNASIMTFIGFGWRSWRKYLARLWGEEEEPDEDSIMSKYLLGVAEQNVSLIPFISELGTLIFHEQSFGRSNLMEPLAEPMRNVLSGTKRVVELSQKYQDTYDLDEMTKLEDQIEIAQSKIIGATLMGTTFATGIPSRLIKDMFTGYADSHTVLQKLGIR